MKTSIYSFPMSFKQLLFCFLTFLILVGWNSAAQAGDPISFGRRAVNEALVTRSLKAAFDVKVTGAAPPESFSITFKKGAAFIAAADTNGALYGLLELAERIHRYGRTSLTGPKITGHPFLRDRR